MYNVQGGADVDIDDGDCEEVDGFGSHDGDKTIQNGKQS